MTALPVRIRTTIALAAALALGAVGALAGAPDSRAGTDQARPNIIVVMTDDQSVTELSERTMPATTRKLGGAGTTFTNSFVSSPLCCPSRAGFITGQYPHNSGVYDNEPGYPALIDKGSTVYGWLQAAGYRTGHIGRWLLNYDREAPLTAGYDTDAGFANPPGIEDWFGYVGAPTLYYGATFSDNGSPVQFGNSEADYTTRVINREALDFIADGAADPRPFFLTVKPLAPHSAHHGSSGPCGRGGLPTPEPGDFGPWKNEELPQPPNFGERKIRDKPHWVETRPRLTPSKVRGLRLAYRCALGTLSTVDRGVRAIVKQLESQGELDDTAIFFTSDNGYFFGEHRLTLNKVYPYEEAIRVPLLARPPAQLGGGKAPAQIDTLVNNLDLTATIVDLAGAIPCTVDGHCRLLDGRSLVPLLRGERPDWSRARALLVQLGGLRSCDGTPLPEKGLNNFYDLIRTRRHAYVELNRADEATGLCDRPEYELYDLKQDPHQLRNRARHPARRQPERIQAHLADRLAQLRNCAGPSCG